MGASFFSERGLGKTAEIAFEQLVEEARFDFGHAGYTGTIAEKTEFKMIECPKGWDPEDWIEEDEALAQVEDKWGPAGCIDLGGGEWLFFGFASS